MRYLNFRSVVAIVVSIVPPSPIMGAVPDLLDDISPGIFEAAREMEITKSILDAKEWSSAAAAAIENHRSVPPSPLSNETVSDLSRKAEEFLERIAHVDVPVVPADPDPHQFKATPDLPDKLRKYIRDHEMRLQEIREREGLAERMKENITLLDEARKAMAKVMKVAAGAGLDLVMDDFPSQMFLELDTHIQRVVGEAMTAATEKQKALQTSYKNHETAFGAWDAIARTIADNFNYPEYVRLQRESMRSAGAEANRTRDRYYHGAHGRNIGGTITTSPERLVTERFVSSWSVGAGVDLSHVENEQMTVAPHESVTMLAVFAGLPTTVSVGPMWRDAPQEDDATLTFAGSCETSAVAQTWTNKEAARATLWASATNDPADGSSSRPAAVHRSLKLMLPDFGVFAWGYRFSNSVRPSIPHDAVLIIQRGEPKSDAPAAFRPRNEAKIENITGGWTVGLWFLRGHAPINLSIRRVGGERVLDKLHQASAGSFYLYPIEGSWPGAADTATLSSANHTLSLKGNWLNEDFFLGQVTQTPGTAQPVAAFFAVRRGC